MKTKPYILAIAGLDPSSGAGLTADIKTFENLKCYGVSVCIATTIQNDVEFKDCYWISISTIKEQIKILFDRFNIDVVKIGIVENWKILLEIIDYVLSFNPTAKIVLDPVLKASSGYTFHKDFTEADFEEVLSKIYLLTPNYSEIQSLYPNKSVEETLSHIQTKTNVFLKGGHNTERLGVDFLYSKGGNKFSFNPKKGKYHEKHGSGCVLSSAIASYIALKYPLLKSCFKGKRYVEKVLSSSKTKLGYHF